MFATKATEIRTITGKNSSRGDSLLYSDKTDFPPTLLRESKILRNSTISDAKEGAQFMYQERHTWPKTGGSFSPRKFNTQLSSV